MKKIFIALFMILSLAFTSCNKETYEPINNDNVEEPIYPQVINLLNNETDYYLDSTDIYAVENHIKSVYLERIRIVDNNIFVDNYVNVSYKYKINGYNESLIEYQTLYSFVIHKQYLEYELNYLNSLKENDGFWNIIETATIHQWMPQSAQFHNKTKCYLTDDQIELIINKLNETL